MKSKLQDENIIAFKEDFEKDFIDFFITANLGKNSNENKDLLYEFATKLYEKIFDSKEDAIDGTIDLQQLKKCEIKFENALGLSLLYLIKNFIKYIKSKNSDINLVETITERVYKYTASLEKECAVENAQKSTHISFGTNDNVVFGKNIIEHFREIKQKNEEVTFFNLYQGVPIKNKAKILDIDGEDVAFQTTRMQEVAMKLDGVAYILQDKRFDKHIRANIVYNNFLDNSVTLNNFTYMLNMPASQREFVRVHPNITAFVTLQENEEEYIIGKLYDLSTDGLGVVGEDKKNLYVGANINVSFTVKEQNINTRGKLINIIEYGNSYRFCLRIAPSGEEKASIIEYVTSRENEILKELAQHLEDYGL